MDATINQFEPATNPELIPPVRPYTRSVFFHYGEFARLCCQALREAETPVSSSFLTNYAIAAKGLDVDALLRKPISKKVRDALGRPEARGRVRRLVAEPEVWWELVG